MWPDGRYCTITYVRTKNGYKMSQKQVRRVGIEPTTLYIVVISSQHLYHLGYVASW